MLSVEQFLLGVVALLLTPLVVFVLVVFVLPVFALVLPVFNLLKNVFFSFRLDLFSAVEFDPILVRQNRYQP